MAHGPVGWLSMPGCHGRGCLSTCRCGRTLSRGPSQRIADVLDAIERCQRYVTVLGDEADADLVGMEEDAIERNLQIIGEAVNHLPDEITGAHPEIAWPQIRGFRNILVHQYFGVDIDGSSRFVVMESVASLA